MAFNPYYVLDENKNPVPADMETAAKMINDTEACRVAYTKVGHKMISTLFLGLHHGRGPTGKPLLFETMVFKGAYDQYQERYETYTEALAGHERVVAMVQAKECRSKKYPKRKEQRNATNDKDV